MKKFDKQFAGEILKYALWFGIVAGLVEGVFLYAMQRYELLRGQITYLGSGPQVLWVAPVFDALFFLLAGIGLASFCRKSLQSRRSSLFSVFWRFLRGCWCIFPVD